MKEKILRLFNLYTEKDLVSFGNYMVSKDRKELFINSYSRLPLEDRLSVVHDADFKNFFNSTK